MNPIIRRIMAWIIQLASQLDRPRAQVVHNARACLHANAAASETGEVSSWLLALPPQQGAALIFSELFVPYESGEDDSLSVSFVRMTEIWCLPQICPSVYSSCGYVHNRIGSGKRLKLNHVDVSWTFDQSRSTHFESMILRQSCYGSSPSRTHSCHVRDWLSL